MAGGVLSAGLLWALLINPRPELAPLVEPVQADLRMRALRKFALES